MGKYNKGQQALEYLITYGWAFVVVLLTIGAFAYFGILSPDKYLPDRCNFGEQLQCVDFLLEAIDGQDGRVHLKFTNNFGEDIVVWGVETVEGYGSFCTETQCPAPAGTSISVPNGRVNTGAIILDLSVNANPAVGENLDYLLFDGEKTTIPIKINFSRDKQGAPYHLIIGDVFAAAQG